MQLFSNLYKGHPVSGDASSPLEESVKILQFTFLEGTILAFMVHNRI
jgi:hypothetical protein